MLQNETDSSIAAADIRFCIPSRLQQIHALTPSDHQDFESLVNVQKEMLQVAEEINEIKKRKDIVEKIVGSKKKHDSDVRSSPRCLAIYVPVPC